jgi:hypothetical protein
MEEWDSGHEQDETILIAGGYGVVPRMWMIPTRARGFRPWCGALALLVVAAGMLGCAEPPKQRLPEEVWRRRVYRAEPAEGNLAGTQLLLLVSLDQDKWRGARDDPAGGVMLGTTMDARAENMAFELTFAPEPETAGLSAVTLKATTSRGGQLCVEIPTAVAQYALDGVGARVALRSAEPDEPGLLLTREVQFEDPADSVLEFPILSRILLEGSGN